MKLAKTTDDSPMRQLGVLFSHRNSPKLAHAAELVRVRCARVVMLCLATAILSAQTEADYARANSLRQKMARRSR